MKTNIEWSDPPKFCPRCGGKNISTCMVEWDAQSKNPQEQLPDGKSGNTCELDEHQCMDCEGASFWT
jgi:5-methylcytosine-specific restriction endonuclease McrA